MNDHKQHGVVAVEMALVLLPMLILCFGITEIGRTLYYYNGLDKATRGAARYLTTIDLANPPVGETAASIRVNAQKIAVCGSLTCDPATATPLVPGLKLANVTICDPVNCAATHNNVLTGQGAVDLVTVTIGGVGQDASIYNFTSLVPWVIPSFAFSPISITMASIYF